MKKILMRDSSLKIISVFIAICIWVYISLVMDPAIEVTVRDLPIQFVGQETLNSKGLSVISESATSITIKLRGSRRRMGNNDMKTIIVKADVSSIRAEGVTSVPLEIVVPFENEGISSQSQYSVDIKTEKYVGKDINIEVRTSGTLAESYMFGDITTDPGRIQISGPESAVGQIQSAAVDLRFDSEDVDIDTELPVRFYNEEGAEILSSDAIIKRVNISNTSVKVHCPVLKIREISPTVDFGDQVLPEGFSCSTEPSVLYLYGDDPSYTYVNEIKTVEVPLEKLIESEKLKVGLVIPDGVRILYDIGEVEVSVNKD